MTLFAIGISMQLVALAMVGLEHRRITASSRWVEEETARLLAESHERIAARRAS